MKVNSGLAFILLIFLADFCQSTENVFWLRGNDATTFIDGNYHYLMSSSPPTMSSHKTTITIAVGNERGELARWYSLPFPSGQVIDGNIYLWLKSPPSGIKFRFLLYDFYNGESSLFASSSWQSASTELMLSSAHVIYSLEAGHSLKLVIEYSSEQGFSMQFDEPESNELYVWKTPTGSEYYLFGIGGTAALLFNSCSSVRCGSDFECNDMDETTVDKCIDAGHCSSFCSNEGCSVECKKDSDCDDGNPLTLDLCNGKGSCSAHCLHENCPIKCEKSSSCNEKPGGYCLYPATCLSNCNYEICPPLLPVAPAKCSSYICKEGRWQEEKTIGCCGNGVCEYEEQGNCTEDCPESNLAIVPLGLKKGAYYARGEKIPLLVKVILGSKELNNAEAYAYINGQMFAMEESGGKYGIDIEVPKDSDNLLKVFVEAKKGADSAKISIPFVIAPTLSVEVLLDKEKYTAGDELYAKGSISRKGSPANSKISFLILCGNTILHKDSNTSSEFLFSYRTTPLLYCESPKIRIEAEDFYGNKGVFEKSLLIEQPVSSEPLEIRVKGIAKEYSRGSPISAEAEVFYNGEKVSNASVQLSLPNGENIVFSEDNNSYYLSSKVPFDVPLGEQEIKVSAVKVNGVFYKGQTSRKVIFKQAKIEANLLNYSFLQDEATIAFSFLYPDNSPVHDINATLSINGSKAELSRIGTNTYVAKYRYNGSPVLQIKLFVEDSYGNFGKLETALESKSIFPADFAISILGYLALALLVVSAFVYINLKRTNTKLLKEREKKLVEEMEAIQKRYFVEGSLKRELYYKLINQYNSELNEIKQKLRGKR